MCVCVCVNEAFLLSWFRDLSRSFRHSLPPPCFPKKEATTDSKYDGGTEGGEKCAEEELPHLFDLCGATCLRCTEWKTGSGASEDRCLFLPPFPPFFENTFNVVGFLFIFSTVFTIAFFFIPVGLDVFGFVFCFASSSFSCSSVLPPNKSTVSAHVFFSSSLLYQRNTVHSNERIRDPGREERR